MSDFNPIVHPAIAAHSMRTVKAGLGFTFAMAATAIMTFSIAAYIEPVKTACAIEYTTTDGNRYRPSVADTCADAWKGFDWQSLPENWREVLAVEIKI